MPNPYSEPKRGPSPYKVGDVVWLKEEYALNFPRIKERPLTISVVNLKGGWNGDDTLRFDEDPSWINVYWWRFTQDSSNPKPTEDDE